jgi:hypothetical protein
MERALTGDEACAVPSRATNSIDLFAYQKFAERTPSLVVRLRTNGQGLYG